MQPATTAANLGGAEKKKIRVMVVDDAIVMRGMMTRIIMAAGPDLEVAATAVNGQLAVERAAKRDIDVVVLDIEMPVLDGISALPKLLAIDPSLVIIMASTLTTRNASISLKALSLGARDYVPKPSSTGDGATLKDFERELVEKIRALAGRSLRAPAAKTGAFAAAPAPAGGPVKLRPVALAKPQVLAIGSSTGGPTALSQFLKDLPRPVRVPILVTQHMPPTFTALLAENLARDTGLPCAEAKEGDTLQAGKVYLAPGDYHMVVAKDGANYVLHLNQEAKEHFCRPAVDPMMRSAADTFKRNVLGVILTGMGQDGMRGATAIVDAGGNVVAQDEVSSVVWGMPGAAARAGLCCDVVSLTRLGKRVGELLGA